MTPADLARHRHDLSARGRFGRKDPSLLALARTLLAELERVTTERDQLREALDTLTRVSERVASRLTADAVPRLDTSAPAGPAESTARAPVDGVGSPSADPAPPAGPTSTTGPARKPVVHLHPAEEPPEVAIRRAREGA